MRRVGLLTSRLFLTVTARRIHNAITIMLYIYPCRASQFVVKSVQDEEARFHTKHGTEYPPVPPSSNPEGEKKKSF
jgi:hypothetical protein